VRGGSVGFSVGYVRFFKICQREFSERRRALRAQLTRFCHRRPATAFANLHGNHDAVIDAHVVSGVECGADGAPKRTRFRFGEQSGFARFASKPHATRAFARRQIQSSAVRALGDGALGTPLERLITPVRPRKRARARVCFVVEHPAVRARRRVNVRGIVRLRKIRVNLHPPFFDAARVHSSRNLHATGTLFTCPSSCSERSSTAPVPRRQRRAIPPSRR
jgi:hypothetical protein